MGTPHARTINMMNHKTPVAIFVYNRSRHVKQLFDSLLACGRLDECDVHIYCDGIKKPEHASNVIAAREVVREYASRFDAIVIERTENIGLAHSIVAGVTDLCSKYGRVIVLEDDLILHPAFLNFMIQALDRYENEEHVVQVAGFTFPIQTPPQPDAFFLPLTTSWGWATWARAWKSYSWDAVDGVEQLSTDAELRKRFDLDGTYPYSNMLRNAMSGKIDSWAIRWYWQTFIRNNLTVYPRQSLVWQNGFDELATHTQKMTGEFQTEFDRFLQTKLNSSMAFPNEVKESDDLFREVKKFLRPKKGLSMTGMYIKLKKILEKLQYEN